MNNYNDIINNLLKKKFPKLEDYSINMLNKYTNYLLNFLLIKIFNNNNDVLNFELKLNDYSNLKRIIFYLLPYIQLDDTVINISSLTELINSKKKNNLYNNDNYDKNLYKYTNIQFEYGDINMAKFIETKYEDDYLKANLNYLLFTINCTYYKLYINWINIFPISYKYYESSNLYKNTFKFNYDINNFMINNITLNWFKFQISELQVNDLDEVLFNSDINNNIINYNGIPFEEVYNVFINYYYNSVQYLSFLFKDIKYNDTTIPLIKRLSYLLEYDLNYNNNNWNLLSENEQYKLLNNWNNIIDCCESDIIFDIIINFNENYDNIGDIKDYKIINNYNNLTTKNVSSNFVDNDNFKYVYDYLLLSLNKLKNTPYYFYLFNEDDENNEDEDIYNINIFKSKYYYLLNNDIYTSGTNNLLRKNNEDTYFFNDRLKVLNKNILYRKDKLLINNIYLTCYDIFLFSKKLYNISEEDNFYACSEFQQNEIVNYFLNSSNNKLNNTINNDITNIINYGYLCVNSFKITFLTLSRLGLLSEFKSNKLLTDYKNNITGSDLQEQEIKIKNNLKIIMNNYDVSEQIITKSKGNFKDLYYDNNYYVNNIKYKDLKWNKYKNKDYFDTLLTNDIKWFTTYTFHWTTQIDFFNKFINKRVILVTGGTGQGKSTFFPMLIYYGLKAFDYNLFGKLVITQPRISPVVENSKYIATQLYVPLKDIDNKNNYNFSDADTLNGHVQYSHSNTSHINLRNYYYMRLVTDGKLFKEIKQNFLLKRKIIKNKKINKFTYLNENIIDAIGIDESHEHNANMDIILSIIKYSMLYNTSIRLFIISATLDDDEPTYRRYYKVIDDNLKYPILNHEYINRINYLRYYIDRRFHITPPGIETRFKIDENYELTEPYTYQEATLIGINRVLDILKTSNTGEILFFTYSSKECIDICNKLNKETSYNIVALPFFRNVLSKYRKYIEDLSSYKKNIDFEKDSIVDIFIGKKEKKNIYNKTQYDRIIIVATNIAEASITINNLKFVIDLGLHLVVSYNPYNNIQEVTIKQISESSRIQRKGRVGRKTSGTVYYIYPKDSRKDNKIEYSICNINVSSILNDLLYNNYLELKLFHNIDFYKDYKYLYELLSDLEKFNTYIDKYNYLPEFFLFKKQFMISDSRSNIKILYTLTNKKQVNSIRLLLNEFKNNYYLTSSGYNYTNIYDNYGFFYIIHPQENLIKRDIRTGLIVKYKNIIDNTFIEYKSLQLKDNKIAYFIDYLKNFNLLVNLNTQYDDYDNYKIAKTNINKLINLISFYFPSVEYELELINLLIYCNKQLYDCSTDIIILISIISECSQLSDLYEYKDNRFNLKFKEYYKNSDSDIFIIIDLIKKFIKEFNIISELSTNNNSYDFYYKKYKNNIAIDVDIYNEFQKQTRELSLNNLENKNNDFNLNLKSIFKSFEFIKWCEYYCLNSISIEKIIYKYKKVNLEFYKFETIEEEKYYNIFEQLEQIYINKNNTTIDNITKCLLTTYKHNLLEYKGSYYNSILKNIKHYNNEIIPNINENIIIQKQYLIFLKLKLITDRKLLINKSVVSYLVNIRNIKDIFEVSFNIYNLKNYIYYDSNFINYYSVVYLNNVLNHNKFFIKHLYEELDTNNLLKYINNKDISMNLNNKNKYSIDLEYYNTRSKILNSIDFYYYFIKSLI